ncbi:DUF6571 family protein [Streptomyces sp. NRRL F-5053]|uniref:DUF6571 family protein n=1 Tax=Streptomyces sp. NRRL F-5053 TaxID=1463854 RepID=UPI00133166EE|nr:DUF6571 family protein [Streptomyces sp. NRRL F-5053]
MHDGPGERRSPQGRRHCRLLREHPEKRQAEETKWTDAIARAVKSTQKADEHVAHLLTYPPKGKSGVPNGFNGAIKDYAGKAGAARVSKTYEAIKNGEHPSATELREAAALTQENADNPEFARTLINTIGGPEGLIKVHNRIDDLTFYDDKDHKKTYVGLDKGLADSLASATRDPKSSFYKGFKDKLKKAGLETYDLKLADKKEAGSHGQGVHGYQSLVSLMERGSGYGNQFLIDTADEIRRAEDPDKGGDSRIWRVHGDFSKSRFAHDPMDGILGVMAENVDPATEHINAATEYLDPGPDKENDNLDYLLKDRNWRNYYSGEGLAGDVGRESSDSREGLAAAIEAGATGDPPSGDSEVPHMNTRHSGAEARIMLGAIEGLDPGVNGDPLPEHLRRPVANALADYAPDTHKILYDAEDERNTSKVIGSEGDARISPEPKSLIRVMRGISDTPEAYSTIYQAERDQIRGEFADLDPKDREEVKQHLTRAAQGLGAFEAIQQDQKMDQRDDAISHEDWKAKVLYHAVGAPLTPIPGTGDVQQRMVDMITWGMAENEKEKVASASEEEMINGWLSADTQVRSLVSSWGESKGLAEDTPFIDNRQHDALRDMRTARKTNLGYLRGTDGD